MQFDGLLPAGNLNGVRTARWGRLNPRLPLAVGCGGRGGGVLCDFHFHRVSWLGPAPNGIRLFPLEDHVVAEDRADKGERRGRLGRLCKRAFAGERQDAYQQARDIGCGSGQFHFQAPQSGMNRMEPIL